MTKDDKLAATQHYFERATSWEYDRYAGMESSRKRAWVIAIIATSFAALELIAIIIMLPLRSFEPYVITVDKSSGYVEVTRTLDKGNISEQVAITQSNLVQYVAMRESFSPHTARENFKRIALYSSPRIYREYEALWSDNNPENPSIIAHATGSTHVHIKSVSMLNTETAQVRFSTKTQHDHTIRERHWVAIIGFTYLQKPAKMHERFQNPLGFQVVSYNKSQEILERTP